MGEDLDDGEVEVLLARYLDLACSVGIPAAEAMLAGSSWRDAVLRRIAELRRLGIIDAALPTPRQPTTAAFAPPARLGAYDLLEVLGRGGMGTVHRALHRRLQRPAAIKCLLPSVHGDTEAVLRFQRETAALARLHHEGIVSILDVGAEDGAEIVPWYAMELIDGPTFERLLRARAAAGTDLHLDALLARTGIGPDGVARHRNCTWPEFTLRLCRDAALALGHAHHHGLVHRDVKPGNLMVRRDGRVVVVDFGLATGPELRRVTQSGDFLGSPLYSAPEHLALGEGRPRPTRDTWSLGIVLCELLTGVHPFAGESAFAAQRRAAQGDLRRWQRQLRHLPSDVTTVCLQAIDPDPARRYQHGDALAHDLTSLLEHRPIAARRAPSTVRLARWVRRRPAAAVVAVMLPLLAIAAPVTIYAGASAAARAHRITTETTRLLANYGAGQIPARAAGRVRLPLPRLREHLAQLDGIDVLPESRANMLLEFGQDALALGDPRLAETCLGTCLQLRRATGAGAGELGRALAALGICRTRRDAQEAPDDIAAALQLLRSDPAVDPHEILQLRLDHCRALYRTGSAHATYDLLDGLLHDLPTDRQDLGDLRIEALAYYGELLALNDRIEQGRPLIEEAMRRLAHRGRRDVVAVHTQAAHAHWLALAGQHEASSAAFDAAVELATEVYGDQDHLQVADVRRERAFGWRQQGRLAECERELSSVLTVFQRNVAPLDGDLFDIVLVLGKCLRDQSRFAEALPLLEQRLQLVRARAEADAAGALDPTNGGGAYRELALVRAETGDFAGAERDLSQAIVLYGQHHEVQPRAIQVGGARSDLAELYARQGHMAQAHASWRAALQELIWAVHCMPEAYLGALRGLHRSLQSNDRGAEAFALVQAELARIGARWPYLAEQSQRQPIWAGATAGNYQRVLGELHVLAGQPDAARRSLQQAVPLLEATLGPEHQRTRAAAQALAQLRGG